MSDTEITTVNPTTGDPISSYPIMDKDKVNDIVKISKKAFHEWKKNYEKRRAHLYSLAEVLRKKKTHLANVATQEMGKTIKESMSEIEKCAWVLEYYADNGKMFLSEEVLNTDARKSFITFDPLGVIGSIMPWNFPYWQALRFAAPSLMAGNTIVLKPSSVTAQCGIELEKACEEAGLPHGVFQTVIGNYTTANHLIDSSANAITFTGSEGAGASVGERTASHIKKCVLELGGSDPFIVLEDANIEKAAEGAVKGRFINCGQSCIASKRFFVEKNVADKFIEAFVKNTSKLRMGDPTLVETDLGPLVNKESIENISSIVEDARKQGAEILVGGSERGDKGYFYEPTVITNVNENMRVAKEETFGPVAPLTIVDNESEAIKRANSSDYGLGASIWTEDLVKAENMSKQIESGIVTVNNVVVSDPRIPFGGIKHSGFGRELSRYGMLEFVNIKSVRFYDNLVHHHYVE